jgi:hypothetical protein
MTSISCGDSWGTEYTLTYEGMPSWTVRNRRETGSQRFLRLLAQLLDAAHMGIARFVKTQQPICIARDADANAVANPANPLRGRAQPKQAAAAQVRSVLPEINVQCLGQSTRTSA